ncbi:ABC transporter ATP-binding protein [bacterium]|nr:ABC transporter ATP-binding protein [bacterium]
MDLSKITTSTAFNYAYLTKKIFPYIKPLIPRIIIAFLVAMPLGLLDGVTAFALKPYIDVVVDGKTMVVAGFTLTRDLLAAVIPVGIVIFAGVQGLLKYLNGYLADWISQTISNSIKCDLFKKLTSFDSYFFDINSSGIVVQRFLNDPDTASRTFVDNLKSLATSATSSLGLIAVLLMSSWKLAIVGVVVLCCAFLPVALIRKRIKKTSNANTVVVGDITTNINETFHGNKIMTGYGLQDKLRTKFNNQIRESFNINMSLVKRATWMSPLMYMIASIGVALVLHFGNTLIIKGEMTTGSFASFVTSLLLLYKPVKDLGRVTTNLQNVFVAMSRVFELFAIEAKITDAKNPIELKEIKKSIKFEQVGFEYEAGKPVLENINLEAKCGEVVAFVGNSGGGKSTAVNLIPRFYDCTQGRITIDDINIKNYSLKSLRENIAEVFQDNFIFTGTIKENIMLGKPDATEVELENAVKLAHLEDVVSELEDGLDTNLAEMGTSLSGGQRQRIAIARAIIKNAPILILDEATSALDNKSEAVVQKALQNLIKNKTVFIIAHRLSTVKDADKIAVIMNGNITEIGRHEELLNIEGGNYKTLYDMQFKHLEEVTA